MRLIVRRLAIALFAAGLAGACNPKAASSAAASGDIKTAPEVVLGNPNAKVTVIEWASLTCPHCARFNEEVFPAFKKKYIDSGQVQDVFREFLTPPEQVAAAGFLIARCAGREKYFNVTDAVFHSQQEMFSTGDVRGILMRIGASAGMSEAQVTACISDEKSLAALNDRLKKAIEVDKIAATPTFMINGTKLEGEQPMAKFDEVIQPLLKK
jgi:protein-disulfide isomerase